MKVESLGSFVKELVKKIKFLVFVVLVLVWLVKCFKL